MGHRWGCAEANTSLFPERRIGEFGGGPNAVRQADRPKKSPESFRKQAWSKRLASSRGRRRFRLVLADFVPVGNQAGSRWLSMGVEGIFARSCVVLSRCASSIETRLGDCYEQDL